jgi:Gametolysin peptidase M11
VRVRSASTAVLIGSLAITAVGVCPGGASAGRAAVAPRSEIPLVDTITVAGTFERVVVDTVDGEQFRYLVRGSDGTWWLEDLVEPVPTTGSQVTVTGTPLDPDTLTVATIQVRVAAAAPAANVPVRGTTRALVLRAYWGRRPPAAPTLAATRNKVIKTSAAWFGEVSHGRYSVSGAVTPWLRVPRPSSCLGGSANVGNQALAAAQRRGFRLSRFQRFILYMPCDAGGILGYAALPGNTVVLFSLAKIVVVHEQGHNLGLRHASSRQCVRAGWQVTWSRRCRVSEYGDAFDAMGNRRAGHFNAYYKARLGWLNSRASVTSTRTLRLAPYEKRGRGFKAIRLRAGRATYWLEYRTRTGADARMLPGTQGVQIRVQAGPQTQLLDAAPRSRIGVHPFDDVHLAKGRSWTTPQRVRITVVDQSTTSAIIAIRFLR